MDIERGEYSIYVLSTFTHSMCSSAMNKLEKVALRSAPKRGRPLVLVINNIHFFQNDEAGRSMLLQLQQKAEAWAASGELESWNASHFTTSHFHVDVGILTMVFATYVVLSLSILVTLYPSEMISGLSKS